jgi:hypothetical protein
MCGPWRNDARCDSSSHARNVGGEEVNAVAVKVAAGAVLVLGGAGGSACRARIWASRSGTPASGALVTYACRRRAGEADRVATAGRIPKAMAYGRASPSPESHGRWGGRPARLAWHWLP